MREGTEGHSPPVDCRVKVSSQDKPSGGGDLKAGSVGTFGSAAGRGAYWNESSQLRRLGRGCGLYRRWRRRNVKRLRDLRCKFGTDSEIGGGGGTTRTGGAGF